MPSDGSAARQYLVCSACASRFAVGAYRPDRTYACRRCGAPLEPERERGRTLTSDGPPAPTVRLEGTRPEPGRSASLAGLLAEGGPRAAVRLRGSPVAEGPAGPGRTLDPREIGRGAMGVVLRAVDADLGRPVAIKVLQADASRRDRRVWRFVREARITGQLEHPNIAPIHELGLTESGQPYFTMKLVKGRSLAEVLEDLRRRGPQSAVRARPRLLADFLKVLDAVAYAHSRGVVHRDLKPDNVMVGEFGEVLVMDWGIAKIPGDEDDLAGELGFGDESSTRLTADGAVLGTPAYMSPEQAEGRAAGVDARSDVYSLGAMLYEILTLEQPHVASSWKELLPKILEGRIEPPSRRRPEAGIPRELDAVVLAAMAVEPGDRYPDVASLKADLEAYLEGRVLKAATYSPLALARVWARRHRGRLLAAAAVVLALAVGIAGVGFVQRREAERRVEAAAAAAETEFAAGAAEWEAAERGVPFNPAAPQDYFQTRLAALLGMARALGDHPARPERFRTEVAARALVLQERAEAIGDWALARILAESVASWGAASEAEREARLARVASAEIEAAEADVARLGEALERIRRAESGLGQGLVPGEIQERARRLAFASGPAVTRDALERLARPAPEASPFQRRFLVEILGRKADLVTPGAGRTAPRAVREALEAALAEGATPDVDEVAAWIVAAARLETRRAGAAGDLPGLLERLGRRFEGSVPIRRALERARDLCDVLLARAALVRPTLDRERYEDQLADLADWVAATARSGSQYTREVLSRLQHEAGFPEGSVVLLFDQLGLRGDLDPPEPERPALAALPVLTAAYERLPAGWLTDRPPEGVERAGWNRARRVAVAAAINRSRLGDPSLAPRLTADREQAGQGAVFAASTQVAAILAPIPDASGDRTAADLVRRANLLRERGEWRAALDHVERALDLQEGIALAHHIRGLCRDRSGDTSGGIESMSRAIALEPGEASHHANRAVLRGKSGDLAGAIADASRAIELAPDPALYLVLRAGWLRERGDLAGAIADCDRAIELQPDLASAWRERSYDRRNAGDLAGALADAERAVGLAPRDPESYSQRAQARQALGDRPGMIEDYTRIIELEPSGAYAYAYSGRGAYRAQAGDLRGALLDLERAIELDPRDAAALGNLEVVRFQLGDVAGAVAAGRRAVVLDASNWEMWKNHAMVLARAGEREEAYRAFAEAYRHAPPDWRPAIEQARLEELGR